MKKIIFIFLIISFAMPALQAQSQANDDDVFKFPQWAKDLRRWDIISFGVFPFSMFFVTFTTDMVRWYNANGMDFSEEGRRYAPWPMKSAGAELMTNDEYYRTILIALGVSASIAIIDFAVINIKRYIERRRLESRPSGSYNIEKRSVNAPQETENNESDNSNIGSD